MLENYKKYTINNHVEFVSYDGDFPNLCSGTLTLRIDGVEYSFGCGCDCDFDVFWRSGGDSGLRCRGQWIINVGKLPEEFRKYAVEIDVVFNLRVERGCCVGCL